MKPIILGGIASRGSKDLRAELFAWVLNEALGNEDYNFKTFVFGVSGYSAAVAQNYLFFDAMKEKWDYIFLMDGDVVPGDGTLSKLLACDKDIVTAPVWHYDEVGTFHLNVHYPDTTVLAHEQIKKRVRTSKDSGVEEIVSSSFAALLIKRKVLETFVGRAETFTDISALTPEYKDMFTDNIFFAKCIRMGFKAYVCWDAKGAVHYKNLRLTENLLDDYVRNLILHDPERVGRIVRGKGVREAW